MQLILNDFSIIGQFENLDKFAAYLFDKVVPVFDFFIKNKIEFYKSYNTNSCYITKELTINELLTTHYNDPVAYKIRKYIIDMAYHDPYWENDVKTLAEVEYSYPVMQEEPNCFSEVIERKAVLFSFAEGGYDKVSFACKRNKEEIIIFNVFDIKTFLDTYLRYDKTNIKFVLENYPMQRSIKLAIVDSKCHSEEALLKSSLTLEDFQNIISYLPRMIDDMYSGRKTRFWDSLGEEIFEYRLSVSAGREFRLLFFQHKELIFTHGFIKKTEKTPPKEIEKAISIKKKYIRSLER